MAEDLMRAAALDAVDESAAGLEPRAQYRAKRGALSHGARAEAFIHPVNGRRRHNSDMAKRP